MGGLPAIALTAGEPAGIGPELCLAAAARPWPARLAAYGSLELLQRLAVRLAPDIRVRAVDLPGNHVPGELQVRPQTRHNADFPIPGSG